MRRPNGTGTRTPTKPRIEPEALAPAPATPNTRDRDRRAGFAVRFARHPAGVVALLFLVGLVVASALASQLAPYGALTQDLDHVLQGPTSKHLLGTDELGRDVLSRLLFGGLTTLSGVGIMVLVALFVGVPLGLITGYVRGFSDAIVSRIADLLLALPSLVILLLIFAIDPGGRTIAMVTLGVLLSPGLFRVTRSAALQAAEELYVRAAEVAGVRRPVIVVRHVLPRVAGPVVVNTSVIACFGLVIQTGLELLQLGVQPPKPSWGGLVASAQQVISRQAWLLVPPAATIGIVILAIITLGDAVRDTLAETSTDPMEAAQPAPQPEIVVAPSEGRLTPTGTLVVEDLTIALERRGGVVPLVTDLSFSVGVGETVAIVGESGCGKSLTALSVVGLLPEGIRVQHGRCLFNGTDLFALGDKAMRDVRGKSIGYISQDPMVSLDPCYSVGNQLTELVRRHQNLNRKAARSTAEELLRAVRLPKPGDVMTRFPHELSGGMAQRVTIALALAGNPSLLIADEPTTSLDVTVQAEVLDLMRAIQAEVGLSIVFITHDFGIVSELCDRVVVLYAGELVEEGAVHAAIATPLHPYTAGLLSCSLHELPAGQEFPTIPGAVARPGHWPAGCRFSSRCEWVTDECLGVEGRRLRDDDARQVRCVRPGVAAGIPAGGAS